MGHLQCTLPLVMQLLLVLIPAAHAAGARTLLQGNSNSTKTTTNAAASAASHPANCTPPRTLKDTKKPFCVVPDNVSPGAREFLSQAAAGGIPWDIGSGNATALAGLRQFYADFSINTSTAAVATFLQSTRNDTIAGVSVVFGVPKGVNSNTKPADTKLLIYLHGGGYIFGSCHYQWSTSVPTAARAGLITLCIEYRLAPEHPFPAGLNDVLAVYKELIKKGYQSNNIVLLGDSAGGGMVAAVTIQLQREGVPLPAALGMLSPWADPDPNMMFDTQYTLIAVDPIILPANSGSGNIAVAYVGGNQDVFTDPLVSPRRADWVQLFPKGTLPPTLIQVGLRESLLSQCVQLYHNLKKAAPAPGHVSISPYDGMWHVFQSFFTLPEAEAAHQEMADFFTRAINGTICKG